MARYFRVQVSHPGDLGRTRVRMKATDMQELGLQRWDVVKVSGARSAHAFCLPLEEDYDSQNEKKFVYLDKQGNKIHEIKLSNLTHANVRGFNFGNLVTVEKSSAIKANKITIRPIHVMGDDGKNYNLDWLDEQVVVSRGDHISGRHDDPKKIPGFFVMGGTPDSHVWIVDKDTPFEISGNMPANDHAMITNMGDLLMVLPVVQKIKGKDFEATISVVEVYDRCMKVIMYIKDSIVHQEDRAGGLCTPTIRAWDDLGNKYVLNRYSGRGGGTQLGGAVWGKTDRLHFSDVSCILDPALDGNARELTLSIEQLLWNVRIHPMHQGITGKIQDGMHTHRLDEKYAIHEGPWEIKVPIK